VFASLPRLFLLSQTGQEEKLFCEDGSQRSFHNVAKNGIFSLVIAQTTNNPPGTPLIKFSNLVIVCTLVYDQNREKPVEAISQKPMEYKLTSLQGGTELRIDARIKVLSSQYEGSLFCVNVQMYDKDRNAIPDLCVYSNPIRVRSKILKPGAAAAATPYGNVLDSPPTSVHSPRKRPVPNALVMPSSKRMRTMARDGTSSSVVKSEFCDDDVNDASASSQLLRVLQTLNRIEARQLEQRTYMESIIVKKEPVSSSSSCGSPDSTSPLSAAESTSVVVGEEPARQAPSSFGEQFLRMMDVFSRMSDTEKQEQVFMIQSYASEIEQHSMFSLLGALTQSVGHYPQQSSSVNDEEPSFDEEDSGVSLF